MRLAILLMTGGALLAQPRFDHVVRNDFFAGMMGNAEALRRGMAKCEEVLQATPNHAEAMVWHGAGLLFESGVQFRQGNREKGMELFSKALAEMDKAVELEPDSIGVRIPRGAALLAASRAMPENPMRRGLFERALADHQRAFDLQKAELDSLGSHPLGELLFALADTHSRLGDAGRADYYYEMILTKLKGSVYAKRAALWKETRQPLPLAETQCVGCHVAR